jgi:aldehyde dehydrogenase (NAD+)
MTAELAAARREPPPATAPDGSLPVYNPYTGEEVGWVASATRADVRHALRTAAGFRSPLGRRQRHDILMRAREALLAEPEVWARRITAESGLCLRDTSREVQRAGDVLLLSAHAALRDEEQIFSSDGEGVPRRTIYTSREPLLGIVAAITPFNHPLNQVAHKVAPAIACNSRVILKPSEKTPLSALAFARLLHEAGLPPEMLQILTGDAAQIVDELVADLSVEVVTFTGSTRIGRMIAAKAGYKRVVLELGGNDPLIVLRDAPLGEAAAAAARGAYQNSGQRCTAVKRILVDAAVADAFVDALAEVTRRLRSGDPLDPDTDVGTVIDDSAAARLEDRVAAAARAGATLVCGGRRTGALFEPTVLDHVPRDCSLVTEESFGPVAPVIRFRDNEEALAIANDSAFALSAGVYTNNLREALSFVRNLHAGTVNVNEVPSFRSEASPFGGIKQSGLGTKEGVNESIKIYSNVKTYSLPF